MRISDWSSDVCSSDLFNNAFSVPLDNLNFLFPSTVNKPEQAEIGYFGQFTADLSGLVTEGLHFTGGFRWSRDYSKRRNVDIRVTPPGAVVIGPSVNQTPTHRESAPIYKDAVEARKSTVEGKRETIGGK